MKQLTQQQADQLVKVLGAAGGLAVSAAAGPAAGIVAEALPALIETAAKLVRGEDPTQAELDLADADRVASAANMNAEAAKALNATS